VESNSGPQNVYKKIYGGPNMLRVGSLNARSAEHKSVLIRDVISDYHIDILALTETWFTPDMPPAILDQAATPGYSTLHQFRHTSRGGGVSFIYRSHLSIRPIKLLTNNTSYERLSIKLEIGGSRINIITVYRLQSVPINVFFDEFTELVESVSEMSGNKIFLGDFNCKGKTSTTIDVRLNYIISNHGLTQNVTVPTHFSSSSKFKDNLLDLVIDRVNPSTVRSIDVFSLGISHHGLVIAVITAPKILPETVSFTARNFKQLDISKCSTLLACASFICNLSDNIGFYLLQMRNDVTAIFDTLIPFRLVTRRQRPMRRPVLSKAVLEAKHSRRLYLNTPILMVELRKNAWHIFRLPPSE